MSDKTIVKLTDGTYAFGDIVAEVPQIGEVWVGHDGDRAEVASPPYEHDGYLHIRYYRIDRGNERLHDGRYSPSLWDCPEVMWLEEFLRYYTRTDEVLDRAGKDRIRVSDYL